MPLPQRTQQTSDGREYEDKNVSDPEPELVAAITEVDPTFAKLTEAAEAITRSRKKPLLVLYYAEEWDSAIEQDDYVSLYEALTDVAKLEIDSPLEDLDVLVHTYGGDPVGAYRLAQMVRDFSRSATFLVPTFAYSGGTLICLAGNEIALGPTGVLSPIDITVRRRPLDPQAGVYSDEVDSPTEVELVAIDNFIQVAKAARIEIELGLRQRGWRKSSTNVENALLCEMTSQLGVLAIAKYYREKSITSDYARELISNRMFRGMAPTSVVDRIIRRLVEEAPAHEFPLDFNMLTAIGLPVRRMPGPLAAATREMERVLAELVREEKICNQIGATRMPYFMFFGYDSAESIVVDTEIVHREESSLDGAVPAIDAATVVEVV